MWKGSATTLAALLAAAVCVWQIPARADHNDQHARAGGMEIYYSIMPTEMIRGYPEKSAERIMHGGIPRGAGQRHVMIALFDAKTKQRINDAEVKAMVGELAMAGEQKKLETMVMAGTVTYGNYFRMNGRGPYRVTVKINRPGVAGAVAASFDYTAWGK